MPALPQFSIDDILTTTRAVRKRLDFSRPVEPEVLHECLDIALQAPTGGNAQRWHFVVVTDPEKRRALGDIYRKGWEVYRALPMNSERAAATLAARSPERAETQKRILSSADYLAEHIHEAPVLLIPCMVGRPEGAPIFQQAGDWGSIVPAIWSFMLAARSRGLGTSWTTVHLFHEEEAANVLGIPYPKITQAALVPVAYTLGTDFKPANREPAEKVVHFDAW